MWANQKLGRSVNARTIQNYVKGRDKECGKIIYDFSNWKWGQNKVDVVQLQYSGPTILAFKEHSQRGSK